MLTKEQTRIDFLPDQSSVITILEGEYTGLKYKYGKVWFENPDSEQPTMQFMYDMVEGVPSDKVAFENDIAHFLHSMLLEQMEAGEVQYTGGEAPSTIQYEEPAPTKNVAQQIMQAPGVFTSKKSESAMGFLDRLAMSGLEAMRRK